MKATVGTTGKPAMTDKRRNHDFMWMYLKCKAVQDLDFALMLTKGDRVRATKRLHPDQRTLIRGMTPGEQEFIRTWLDEIRNGSPAMTLQELITRNTAP